MVSTAGQAVGGPAGTHATHSEAADTNASNAVPSVAQGVSQTSEGQGSAIQPAGSVQEEESAFSAAEEVAGPARTRAVAGQRAGAGALRPTTSMISTAVQRPPSPGHHHQGGHQRDQHAQSPKVYRTTSVVSQTPAAAAERQGKQQQAQGPRQGTPASVYGQMSVGGRPPGPSGPRSLASGAGQVDTDEEAPLSNGVAPRQQQQRWLQDLQQQQQPMHLPPMPAYMQQPGNTSQNGVVYNTLGHLPATPSTLASRPPLLHLPAYGSGLIIPGAAASSPSALLMHAHPLGGTNSGAGPSNPVNAAPMGMANHAVHATWQALQQLGHLGLIQQLVTGQAAPLIPANTAPLPDSAAVPAGADLSGLALLLPAPVHNGSSMQQDSAQPDAPQLKQGEGMGSVAAMDQLAGGLVATGQVPGYSTVGGVAGLLAEPFHTGAQGALASPALSLVCPAAAHLTGRAHTPAATQAGSVSTAPARGVGSTLTHPTLSRAQPDPHAFGSQPGGFEAAIVSMQSTHRHSQQHHHPQGALVMAHPHYLQQAALAVAAPAVSVVGEHATGQPLAACSHHVAAPAAPAGISTSRAGHAGYGQHLHTNPSGQLSDSCVTQQQGTSLHASALRPPSRPAGSQRKPPGEADGDNDACDDNEGVLATSIGHHAAGPPQPASSTVAGNTTPGGQDPAAQVFQHDEHPGHISSAGAYVSKSSRHMQRTSTVGTGPGMAHVPSGGPADMQISRQSLQAVSVGKASQQDAAAATAEPGGVADMMGVVPQNASQLGAAGSLNGPTADAGGAGARRRGSNDPHEAVSQVPSVLAIAAGTTDAAAVQAAPGMSAGVGWAPAGGNHRPAQQWEEADARSVDGVAQGAAGGAGHAAAGNADWQPDLNTTQMSDVEVDGCQASMAVRGRVSMIHSSSSHSLMSGSGSGSTDGSRGAQAADAAAVSGCPRDDSPAMEAALGTATPAVAMILGEGPLTEGDPSVSDAEGADMPPAGPAPAVSGEIGNSKYAGSRATDMHMSSIVTARPAGSFMTATAGNAGAESVAAAAGDVAVNAGTHVPSAAPRAASSRGTWHGSAPAGSGHQGSADQGELQQGQEPGRSREHGVVAGADRQHQDVRMRYACEPDASVHAMVATNEPGGAEVAMGMSVHAPTLPMHSWQQVAQHSSLQAPLNVAVQQDAMLDGPASSHGTRDSSLPPVHQAAQGGAGAAHRQHTESSRQAAEHSERRAASPPAAGQHARGQHTEVGASRQGSPLQWAAAGGHPPFRPNAASHDMSGGAGHAGGGQGPDSSMAMATAGPSTRSATISGGGAPSQSNTVELSWRPDSQMAEASQSSNGNAAVSHGAEAGGAQPSHEHAYSLERASRSHVEAQGAALAGGHGGGPAGSDMEVEGAGPQHAVDVGSPMAGSAAGGSTLLAGPDTPTAAEPAAPQLLLAAGLASAGWPATLSTMSNAISRQPAGMSNGVLAGGPGDGHGVVGPPGADTWAGMLPAWVLSGLGTAALPEVPLQGAAGPSAAGPQEDSTGKRTQVGQGSHAPGPASVGQDRQASRCSGGEAAQGPSTSANHNHSHSHSHRARDAIIGSCHRVNSHGSMGEGGGVDDGQSGPNQDAAASACLADELSDSLAGRHSGSSSLQRPNKRKRGGPPE